MQFQSSSHHNKKQALQRHCQGDKKTGKLRGTICQRHFRFMCVIQTYEEPLKSWLYKESNLEKHMRTAHGEMACGEDLLANPVSRIETTMTYVA